MECFMNFPHSAFSTLRTPHSAILIIHRTKKKRRVENRRQDSWDNGVEGKEEIRLSRNEDWSPPEEKRNPFKPGVV